MDTKPIMYIIPITPARMHGVYRALARDLATQRAAHRALLNHRARTLLATVEARDRDHLRELVLSSQLVLVEEWGRLPRRSPRRG